MLDRQLALRLGIMGGDRNRFYNFKQEVYKRHLLNKELNRERKMEFCK